MFTLVWISLTHNYGHFMANGGRALHYVISIGRNSRGSIEAAYVTRLDLASHWHIFSFKCTSCHGEVEYQKIILVRSSPHELLTEIGWNSWKNDVWNSVKTHHCFYEHGATVAKRKENNAACSASQPSNYWNMPVILCCLQYSSSLLKNNRRL